MHLQAPAGWTLGTSAAPNLAAWLQSVEAQVQRLTAADQQAVLWDMAAFVWPLDLLRSAAQASLGCHCTCAAFLTCCLARPAAPSCNCTPDQACGLSCHALPVQHSRLEMDKAGLQPADRDLSRASSARVLPALEGTQLRAAGVIAPLISGHLYCLHHSTLPPACIRFLIPCAAGSCSSGRHV